MAKVEYDSANRSSARLGTGASRIPVVPNGREHSPNNALATMPSENGVSLDLEPDLAEFLREFAGPNLMTTVPSPRREPIAQAGYVPGTKGVDVVRLYKQDLYKNVPPLLSHEEEIGLGIRIEDGRKAARALDSKRFSSEEEESQLRRDVDSGKAAATHLTEANLRFVMKIAARYIVEVSVLRI